MTRLRDIGISTGSLPTGEWNAITDVPGVRVGHKTLIAGDGPRRIGIGPIRTGVTVVVPHSEPVWRQPVFAGSHRLNGYGEICGLEWIRESGLLTTPIGLTNTNSLGVVRDALITHEAADRGPGEYWALPVVGETCDVVLNDINGMHVRPEHVFEALEGASDGHVEEGSVGGGTGMIAHGFKGGIGTSSRVLPGEVGGWTVGVLVQANYGRRERFCLNGVPVGVRIPASEVPTPSWFERLGGGSIIVIVATDAPLLPGQCDRLAQRAGLGVGRLGGVGENYSGDLFLAFATGNRSLPGFDLSDAQPLTAGLEMLSHHFMTPLFDAVVESTEEAILNSMLAAETMVGCDGETVYALEPERLVAAMEAS